MNPDWQIGPEDAIPQHARALAAGVTAIPQKLTVGAAKAALTVTFASNVAAADTIVVGPNTFTFVTTGAAAHQANIGVSATTSVDAFVTMFNADTTKNLGLVASNVGGNLVLTGGAYGTKYNGITVAVTGTHMNIAAAASGVTAGGVESKVSTDRQVANIVATTTALHFNLYPGLEGQEKTVVLTAVGGGGSAVLHFNSANTLTLSAAAQYGRLIYLGGTWLAAGGSGTFA
jgi:hypothetical protein